jgi:UrcA family protein
MKCATALVASILSLATLDARSAGLADDGYAVSVKFGDLDLTREAGIARLYARIKGAAGRVCYQQSIDQPGAQETYPVCVRRAVSTAVARIDRPMLSEYVARLNGTPAVTSPASVAAL